MTHSGWMVSLLDRAGALVLERIGVAEVFRVAVVAPVVTRGRVAPPRPVVTDRPPAVDRPADAVAVLAPVPVLARWAVPGLEDVDRLAEPAAFARAAGFGVAGEDAGRCASGAGARMNSPFSLNGMVWLAMDVWGLVAARLVAAGVLQPRLQLQLQLRLQQRLQRLHWQGGQPLP